MVVFLELLSNKRQNMNSKLNITGMYCHNNPRITNCIPVGEKQNYYSSKTTKREGMSLIRWMDMNYLLSK